MLPARFIHEAADVPPRPVLPAPLPSSQQLNIWLCQIALAWYAVDQPSVELVQELGAALSTAVVALEDFATAQRVERAVAPPPPQRPSSSRSRAPQVARRPAGRQRSRSPPRAGAPAFLVPSSVLANGVVRDILALSGLTPEAFGVVADDD